MGKRAKVRPLAEQQVVLTVPARFDEEARELTVQAAHDAGIENLTLLEEPAAAFYSWIANQLRALAQATLRRPDRAGLRRRRRHQRFHSRSASIARRQVDFTRTAVGKHLLLGGDNLDLTLAWLAEIETRQDSFPFASAAACAASVPPRKKLLLCDRDIRKASKSPCSAADLADRRHSQNRDHARRSAGTGARWLSAAHASAAKSRKEEKRSVFRELGLPYVSDPAISRHLAGVSRNRRGQRGLDAILFNGGFFIPRNLARARRRCGRKLVRPRPEIFENHDLDLAVASGAAYYSYVRSTGGGVLVRGGLPRAYYRSACRTSTCSAPSA